MANTINEETAVKTGSLSQRRYNHCYRFPSPGNFPPGFYLTGSLILGVGCQGAGSAPGAVLVLGVNWSRGTSWSQTREVLGRWFLLLLLRLDIGGS